VFKSSIHSLSQQMTDDSFILLQKIAFGMLATLWTSGWQHCGQVVGDTVDRWLVTLATVNEDSDLNSDWQMISTYRSYIPHKLEKHC